MEEAEMPLPVSQLADRLVCVLFLLTATGISAGRRNDEEEEENWTTAGHGCRVGTDRQRAMEGTATIAAAGPCRANRAPTNAVDTRPAAGR